MDDEWTKLEKLLDVEKRHIKKSAPYWDTVRHVRKLEGKGNVGGDSGGIVLLAMFVFIVGIPLLGGCYGLMLMFQEF